MKKKITILISLITCLVCLPLCGCHASIFYERAGEFDKINAVDLYYNKYTKKAFASAYMWDGEKNTMEITVPDTCNGCKVTDLGGYHGSGAISPFCVVMPEVYQGKEAITLYSSKPEESSDKNTERFTFTVNIGKNLKTLKRVLSGYYAYGDTETNTVEQFYLIEFYYVCSEENPTFYSKDGVLYLKSTNEKAQYVVGGNQ